MYNGVLSANQVAMYNCVLRVNQVTLRILMEYSNYVSTSGRTVCHRALLIQAFIFVLTTSRMPLILVATDLFADYLAMCT